MRYELCMSWNHKPILIQPNHTRTFLTKTQKSQQQNPQNTRADQVSIPIKNPDWDLGFYFP